MYFQNDSLELANKAIFLIVLIVGLVGGIALDYYFLLRNVQITKWHALLASISLGIGSFIASVIYFYITSPTHTSWVVGPNYQPHFWERPLGHIIIASLGAAIIFAMKWRILKRRCPQNFESKDIYRLVISTVLQNYYFPMFVVVMFNGLILLATNISR